MAGFGSSTTNKISNTIEAFVADVPLSPKTITAVNGKAIRLSATDNPEIKTYAAAGSLAFTIGGTGLGVTVGAATADNEIDNTVKTYISGATVTGGSLELTSSSNSSIEALAVAGSISVNMAIASLGLAGGGASATNDLSNDLESFIGDHRLFRLVG